MQRVGLSLRVSQELLDRIEDRADAEGRTRSNMAVRLIEAALSVPVFVDGSTSGMADYSFATSPTGGVLPPRPKEAEAAVAEKIGEGVHAHRWEHSPTSAFPKRQVCAVPGCGLVHPRPDAGKENR